MAVVATGDGDADAEEDDVRPEMPPLAPTGAKSPIILPIAGSDDDSRCPPIVAISDIPAASGGDFKTLDIGDAAADAEEAVAMEVVVVVVVTGVVGVVCSCCPAPAILFSAVTRRNK